MGLFTLAVDFLILVVFLRALVAPLVLVTASALVVAASLGVTTWIFTGVLGGPGFTFYVPFAAEVLLISFGSDYNLYLVGRMWETEEELPMRRAIARATAQASSAINIAGVTLAGTFAMLALVDLRSFHALACAMVVGLVVDTFFVRSFLVPAALSLLGRTARWPGHHVAAYLRARARWGLAWSTRNGRRRGDAGGDAVINTTMRDAVGVVELDRHERRNALDGEHCDSLAAAVADLVTAGARALVVTGAGTCFSAGADLAGVHGPEFRGRLYAALRAVTDCPVPVVAAVNGPAVGAGTQLAIACDLRVAAPGAYFAIPAAAKGFAVDPWTIRRLALLAGGGAARALLLGGDRIDADLALRRGLVDRFGDVGDALAWAGEVASFATGTLTYTKRALAALHEPRPWDRQLDEAFEACWRDLATG